MEPFAEEARELLRSEVFSTANSTAMRLEAGRLARTLAPQDVDNRAIWLKAQISENLPKQNLNEMGKTLEHLKKQALKLGRIVVAVAMLAMERRMVKDENVARREQRERSQKLEREEAGWLDSVRRPQSHVSWRRYFVSGIEPRGGTTRKGGIYLETESIPALAPNMTPNARAPPGGMVRKTEGSKNQDVGLPEGRDLTVDPPNPRMPGMLGPEKIQS